jgi:hypothetical protein
VCAPEDADPVLQTLADAGEKAAVRIGTIRAGGDGVRYE